MRLLVLLLLCELAWARKGWCAKLIFEHWRFCFSFFLFTAKQVVDAKGMDPP